MIGTGQSCIVLMQLPARSFIAENSVYLRWLKIMKMDISISHLIILVIVGLMAGALSGFVGVGGGIIIVPAMIYFLNVPQLQAQGISLAVLLMPVGAFGVWNYYKAGHVDFRFALVIAAGFVVGSYFGSRYALKLPEHKIKFIFGLLLLYVAGQMLWKSGSKWFSEGL